MIESHRVYLNHAGTSWPKPRAVHDAVQDLWDCTPDVWGENFETAHRQVADFFHIPETNQLLITPACTTALSIAVFDHFWNAGDRVLTTGFEHHALHRPLVKLVDQGVDVEIIPNLPQEPIILEALEDMLRDGNVKMVAMTAASNVTGELMPYKAVIALAHRYEALVLIDAAQIAGWWDLDLPKLGADLVAFAGHKGTQGPWGIGGLYISPDIKMNSPAAVCEITYDKNTGKPTPVTVGPGWCDGGSVDRPALAGLAAGTQWLSQPAQVNRLAEARQRSQQLYLAISGLPNTIMYGSAEMSERMPTVAFNIRSKDSILVASSLHERGIHVAGGMQCAPLTHKTLETAPEGVVRLSVGPGNTDADIAVAIDAITKLAGS